MMTILSETLIADLIERTRLIMNEAEKLKQLSLDQLNQHPAPGSWSVLECIEHLNLYGDYYLPEIEKQIQQSKTSADEVFKPGMLGNYFAEMMLPREKLNTMKTFKDKNPSGSQLNKETLDRFVEQQQKMLHLLNSARKVSLNKTKTGISISRWIKLKLGDTFRVVVYHNERHIAQANRCIDKLS